MKAYLLRKAGAPDSLKIEEVSEPTPKSGEVKIKISHIGLNYAEILSRRGQYSWAPKKPYIPGMEAFGEVVEVGEGVDSVKVGYKVIAGSQYGSYAEYICVRQYLAFPAPNGYSPEEAVSFLVNYMTAWVALKKLGRIESGEKVLIQAAAGGVGTAAVQLAKAFGGIVFGTASKDEKLNLLSELGCDYPINYASTDFKQFIEGQAGGVDLVLEVVGGDVFKKSIELLNPFGRLVVVGFASISLKKWNPFTYWKTWKDAPKVNVLKMAQGSYGIMGTHIGYLTGNEEISKNEGKAMTDFVEKHGIRPVVGKIFSFDHMAAAHEWIESRQSVGKVIVKI